MTHARFGRPEIGLLVAAALFGSTFVVVQDAIASADPLVFLALRFGIASAVLWGVAWVQQRRSPGMASVSVLGWSTVVDGTLAGLALSAGYWTQTEGLRFTTTTASAFITYLLVVFVPLISWIVWRRVPNRWTVAGLVISLLGLASLNGGGLGLGKGEFLTVLCAAAFASHIVVLEARSDRHRAVVLAAVQLTTVTVVMSVAAVLSGSDPTLSRAALGGAVFTAVGASAVGFSLQTWAQARVESTRAALLLTTETVVAAVLGVMVGERLGVREWCGVALILCGVILAELRGRVPRAQTTP